MEREVEEYFISESIEHRHYLRKILFCRIRLLHRNAKPSAGVCSIISNELS